MRSFRWITTLLLTTFFLLSLIAVLQPIVREALREQLRRPYRKILSVVNGDVFNNGTSAKVIKVRTEAGLFIEIYGEETATGQRILLTSLKLPDLQDGYFHFHGEAANLALQVMSPDNQLEIIAPTFDENLIAHLNIYHYNAAHARIEPLSSKL